jgi:polyribonucleotide nucleotidyltransferase
MIRSIIEETGVKIDVEDDGTVYVSSADGDSMTKAVAKINRVTAEAEIGKVYKGTVRKIVDFGAFVEILPGTDGLVHISQLGPGRVRRVSDVLNEGDEIMVRCWKSTVRARFVSAIASCSKASVAHLGMNDASYVLDNGLRLLSEKCLGCLQ